MAWARLSDEDISMVSGLENGLSALLDQRGAAKARFQLRIIQRIVQPPALFSQKCAVDDEGGHGGEIAQFQEVGGHVVAPVELLDFALEVPEPGRGALQSLGGADDADVVPH